MIHFAIFHPFKNEHIATKLDIQRPGTRMIFQLATPVKGSVAFLDAKVGLSA